MQYDNLPIFRSCMQLVVYIETIVRRFEKYHKYTIGVDLRRRSQRMLFLIHRANTARQKETLLLRLRDGCEDMKMTIRIAKELQAFGGFKQFEESSRLCVEVCRQAQAWLNHQAGADHA